MEHLTYKLLYGLVVVFFGDNMYYLLTFMILFPTAANAYLDPVSGSIFVQIIVSFFVGITVFFKKVRNVLFIIPLKYISAKFNKRKKNN